MLVIFFWQYVTLIGFPQTAFLNQTYPAKRNGMDTANDKMSEHFFKPFLLYHWGKGVKILGLLVNAL